MLKRLIVSTIMVITLTIGFSLHVYSYVGDNVAEYYAPAIKCDDYYEQLPDFILDLIYRLKTYTFFEDWESESIVRQELMLHGIDPTLNHTLLIIESEQNESEQRNLIRNIIMVTYMFPSPRMVQVTFRNIGDPLDRLWGDVLLRNDFNLPIGSAAFSFNNIGILMTRTVIAFVDPHHAFRIGGGFIIVNAVDGFDTTSAYFIFSTI